MVEVGELLLLQADFFDLLARPKTSIRGSAGFQVAQLGLNKCPKVPRGTVDVFVDPMQLAVEA